MNKNNYTIIALGGSIIFPASGGINIEFLKKFRELILNHLKQGKKFIIVAGGGNICRIYQKAASKIVNINNKDLDWLGIYSTHLNAHFLRTIFFKKAYPVIIDNFKKPIKGNPCLIIASGWQPGSSTDFSAIRLAQRFKVNSVIIASNISYVYEKDPAKYKKAKKFTKIKWQDYRKLITNNWKPGISTPVDPIAAKFAQKLKFKTVFLKGIDLKNLDNYLKDKKFKGTILY